MTSGPAAGETPPCRIHFVVAMACEARPLVRHYGLSRVADSGPFPVFAGDECLLVVSGVGKVAAAAATAFLYAYSGNRDHQAWFNAGVAGHPCRQLGEAVLAHKVAERATARSWYPVLLFDPPVATDGVLTVDRVATGYSREVLYEMEAAGFWPTACRFSSAEVVHCFKVVSDHRGSPVHELDERRIEALMEGSLEALVRVVDAVRPLARELAEQESEPPELAAFVERWHFTVTQRRRLDRLLRRWRVRAPGERPLTADLEGLVRGRDVLARLEARLDACPTPLTGQAGEG